MSKLPRRLQIIAELVNFRNICDVGCDHGKLSEYLLKNNKVDNVIVSDISQASLNKAIELLTAGNFNFEYICCDGLSGYKDKSVDQCIISGMGGDEIIKIISNSPIKIKSFILSPQHNNIDVKKFMISMGYNIDYDIIIKDKGKFYNIFRCISSDTTQYISSFDLVFGKDNFDNPNSDIGEFVDNELIKTQNILQQSPDNENYIKYYELLKEFKKRK